MEVTLMSLRNEAAEPMKDSIMTKIVSILLGFFMAEDQDWDN
jgi:hypothetical protein